MALFGATLIIKIQKIGRQSKLSKCHMKALIGYQNSLISLNFLTIQLFITHLAAEQRKLQGLVAETKKIQQQTKPIAGYEGCLPGYSVVVPYRGLVHPPQNIKIVDVKGSSAVVQWSLWSLG